MQTQFTPRYSITPRITEFLARIETVKEKITHTSLTPTILTSLHEATCLKITHYATKMAGNKLEPKQIENLLKHQEHIPNHEHNENEIKAYYAALKMVEQWANKKIIITENHLQTLHALVLSNNQQAEKQTPYRTDENIIREEKTNYIIYIPPAAHHVSDLMQQMIAWINNTDAPCLIVAGIAHYQLVTIRPYTDGNRRVACLLTTLILHLGGYDLKGLCCLEEYYAHTLKSYANNINVGPSHSYASGRAHADITRWVDYFTEGLAITYEKVLAQIPQALADGHQQERDYNTLMRQLDLRQRKVLALFQTFEVITAKQIGELFDIRARASSELCKNWVEKGFLAIVNHATKSRTYTLAKPYDILIVEHRYNPTLFNTQRESAGL